MAGSVTKIAVARKSKPQMDGGGALGEALDDGLRLALGLSEGDALLDGDCEGLGLIDADPLEDGDTLADGETDGETELDGLTLALGDTLALGERLGDTDDETDDSPLISSSPVSVGLATERVNDALALLPLAS